MDKLDFIPDEDLLLYEFSKLLGKDGNGADVNFSNVAASADNYVGAAFQDSVKEFVASIA